MVLLSFGGPESPDDVMPFLENVTRGRGIPRERLEEVAEHYYHLGGKSPLNSLNLQIIDNLRAELAASGRELPVFFANRNWAPYVEDVTAELAEQKIARAAVFATSAWGGYSGCGQYHEDIARARAAVGDAAPEMIKLGQFFSTERFISTFAAATRTQLDAAIEAGERPRLVFTAHSIPISADKAAGPDEESRGLYSRQVRSAAELVAAEAGVDDFDLVWQSRSGPPQVPWLEPDIVDHATSLAEAGETSLVVCPIGFISDHVEVVWDLDNELAEECESLGVTLRRAATPGDTTEFARMVLDLLAEVETGESPARLGEVPSYGCRANGVACGTACCALFGRG
nr:ferrochelatase [Dietzia timorensis]